MAKELAVWQCEKCGELYTGKNSAQWCEGRHAAFETLQLQAQSYDSAHEAPKLLQFEFKDKAGFVRTVQYERKQHAQTGCL